MAHSKLEDLSANLASIDVTLGPTVAESDLQRFERSNSVILPVEYRTFLSHVDNGGDGPGYGLDRFDPEAMREQVGKPFPLSAAWVWDDDLRAAPALVDACRNGWLKIGTEGCGMDWVVVVTGPQRGQVWNIEDQGAQPCAPARDFIEWYALWVGWVAAGGDNSGRSWWDTVWADYAEK
jgi:hypothetical protein